MPWDAQRRFVPVTDLMFRLKHGIYPLQAYPISREYLHTGEKHEAVIKAFDSDTKTLSISIKEAKPHPFDGAESRHPVNSRRASLITGKYGGGVFCRIEEGLDCLCKYLPEQSDSDFHIGDRVIIVIKKYNYERKLIFGRILARW